MTKLTNVNKSFDNFENSSIIMKEVNLDNRIKDSDELPLVLDVNDIAKVMGISKGNAYELMHSRGFPTVKVGRRYIVPRAAFESWMLNPFVFEREENSYVKKNKW